MSERAHVRVARGAEAIETSMSSTTVKCHLPSAQCSVLSVRPWSESFALTVTPSVSIAASHRHTLFALGVSVFLSATVRYRGHDYGTYLLEV